MIAQRAKAKFYAKHAHRPAPHDKEKISPKLPV